MDVTGAVRLGRGRVRASRAAADSIEKLDIRAHRPDRAGLLWGKWEVR